MSHKYPTTLILFLIILFVSSCSESNGEKPDLIEQGEMRTSTVADTCLCDELMTDSSDNYIKDGDLFTGICIHYYPGSDITSMARSIMSGKLHGLVTYYDRKGNVLVEEIYENGRKKLTGGAPMECDCSELEAVSSPGEQISRYFLNEIPFSGKCTEKYPESEQLYMETSYESGIRQGFTIFYDKSGQTMYMEKYDKGKLIKTIFEANN